MADNLFPTPTLRLIAELFAQARQLLSAEIALARAELAESATSLASGISALVAGGAVMFAGLIVLLLSLGLFLLRFRVPADLAFFLVAVVALLVGWFVVRAAGRKLAPVSLMPNRSIAQASLLFGRRV